MVALQIDNSYVPSDTYNRIYSFVKRIPKGKVVTYGQIAKWVGCFGPRQVGYALHALLENSGVPWHRVVNSKGEISLRSGSDVHDLQRIFLEAEGVAFDERNRISLRRFAWHPT